MKKILITTGGTGGHVTPAKIIEEHLKNNFKIKTNTICCYPTDQNFINALLILGLAVGAINYEYL